MGERREVVVITGASAGVGRAIAREFGRRGAAVALIARGGDGLSAAAREIEALGGRALPLPADVAEADQIDLAADVVERQLGPMDVWVPPIYQPEVPARAIYWAAHHRRRELRVGLSTVKAIVGNKVAPGLLDRYLARKGFTGQQTRVPRDAGAPDNLFQPVAGDRGAHGRFDDRARGRCAQSWMDRHRGLVAAGVVLLAVAHRLIVHRMHNRDSSG